MPNIVTFDTDRLLIVEIPVYTSPEPSPLTLEDNLLDFKEIYSEAKEFFLGSGSPAGNLGFPFPIRYVGADPITDVENLGTAFFLQNGWRIKPAEGNHRLTIDGAVFTDPAGQSIFVPTDGPYTVNCENKVSSLITGLVALTNRLSALESRTTALEDNYNTIRKILQNEQITDPTTGKMTILDDDDTTPLLEADIFETVDESPQIKYRGRGADRRTRLK